MKRVSELVNRASKQSECIKSERCGASEGSGHREAECCGAHEPSEKLKRTNIASEWPIDNAIVSRGNVHICSKLDLICVHILRAWCWAKSRSSRQQIKSQLVQL